MQNTDAERTVLGVALIKPDFLKDKLLNVTEDYFSFKYHRQVYNMILKMYREGKPIDLITVSTSLQEAGLLDNMGGRPFITKIVEEIITTSNVSFYVSILEKNCKLRRLFNISEQLKSGVEQGANPDELTSTCMNELHNVALDDQEDDCVNLLESPNYLLEHIDEEREDEGNFLTLYPAIDEKVVICRGDVVAVGADTTVGKSVFCGCMALSAHHQDIPVTIFSLEMKKYEYINRLYANVCEIDISKFKRKEFSDKERDTLEKATRSLFNHFDLTIYDKPNVDTDYIRQKLLIEKKRRGSLGLVIVDHIQFMKGKGQSEKQQLTQIAEGLKCIAMELDCFIIMVSQFKRRDFKNMKGETITPRPTLHDFKESGDIENAANIAFLLHRPNSESVLAELIVAKNRDGERDFSVMLNFYGKYCKFTSTKKQNF